jgi:hypothetical protein
MACRSRAFLGRQRAELLEQGGQLAALAEVAHAHLVEAARSAAAAISSTAAACSAGNTESGGFGHSQIFRLGL